jgi:electron transport complex protein RnfC
MMGVALPRLDLPVIKATSGILALGREAVAPAELACMHCGRCSEACPMRLVPNMLDAAARNSRWEVAEAYNAPACIECGSCTYACPSKRQLTQSCRTAKAGIQARRAAEQAADRAADGKKEG